jgi:hypothetical protein
MRTHLRRAFLVTTPLALAVLLTFHPPGGDPVYEAVSPDADAWLAVHVGMLPFLALLPLAMYTLLRDLHGRAATVSRIALVPFMVFYTFWETVVGVATGVLARYANGLPAADRQPIADAIQDLNRNWLIGDPSVFGAIGAVGWIVAAIAAAFALRRAGAGQGAVLLVGFSSLFVVHPPPIGPIGLASFAAGAVMVERFIARRARFRGTAIATTV